MSAPSAYPPKVRLYCMGSDARGLHQLNVVGVAHWLTYDRMEIRTEAGQLPGNEIVEGRKILGYELTCSQCQGTMQLEFDQDGWRERLVAATALPGIGRLDISNDLVARRGQQDSNAPLGRSWFRSSLGRYV
jgi:hypothetical protein